MGICVCNTCKKVIFSLGISRHRAMHRDKKQDCEIIYSDGKTYIHKFSQRRNPSEMDGLINGYPATSPEQDGGK